MTKTFSKYLAKHRTSHLEQLKDFLRIPSISTLNAHQDDMLKCANHAADHLKSVGFEHTRIIETGGHPVVYGDWLHAPDKPTVLIYGHYDVQPVDPVEKWASPPFKPEIREDKIYARGAVDDKGQVFMHMKAFEALMETTGSLPINVKFCIEGEEEIGSPHFPDFLAEHQDLLASDTVVISDTAMIAHNEPSICYGLRGQVSFQIDVKGANTDLPSGSFYGGAIQNPLQALAELLSAMHDKNGRITIDDFYEDVVPATDAEKQAFRELPFNDQQLAKALEVPELFGEENYSTLERVWTRPSFIINGIYGGYQGEGSKGVIPSEAHAKIQFRLVPNQMPERIQSLVERHIETHSPKGVTVKVTRTESAHPYIAPIDHPALQSAAEAMKNGFGKPVHFIRAGGSIPIVADLATLLEAPVVMIGFSGPDVNTHAPNEHFPLDSFDKGLLTLCHYWNSLSKAIQGEEK